MAEPVSVEACAIIQLEAWPEMQAAFEAELSRQLDAALPAGFGEAVSVGGWLAVRIAPRRFWLIGQDRAQPPRLTIDPALGCSLSLDEGRMRLRLSGTRTFEILKACVAIDWESPQASPGSALQTGFHHVPVLLLRARPDSCDILAPRSFAQSLVARMADIQGPATFRR